LLNKNKNANFFCFYWIFYLNIALLLIFFGIYKNKLSASLSLNYSLIVLNVFGLFTKYKIKQEKNAIGMMILWSFERLTKYYYNHSKIRIEMNTLNSTIMHNAYNNNIIVIVIIV